MNSIKVYCDFLFDVARAVEVTKRNGDNGFNKRSNGANGVNGGHTEWSRRRPTAGVRGDPKIVMTSSVRILLLFVITIFGSPHRAQRGRDLVLRSSSFSPLPPS
jgi:hypothetical protein